MFNRFASPDIDIDAYLSYLKKDKKNTSTGIRVILSRGYGDMFLTQVEADEAFKGIIAKCFEGFQQETNK